MDPAGRPAGGRPLSQTPTLSISSVLSVFFLIACAFPQSQTDSQLLDQVKELSSQQRWQDVVNLAGTDLSHSADLNFYVGTALANLGHWADARKAFSTGARLSPSDKRFPQELAGVAFKQKQYSRAAQYLHRALKLDTKDSYSLDFLGTVYFLEGNLEAALKYWNQVGKPKIERVLSEPEPRVKPQLLDHTFAFSAASTLSRSELLTSQARVRELGIFPSFQFELQARDDGNFDVVFRNHEKDGCGGKWECIFGLLRGLPAQSVYPEFFNLRHRAINIRTSYRWDAQKRRIDGEVAGPFGNDVKHRYRLLADLRNENWNIRNSFTGPAPLLGSLNLRRQAVNTDFLTIESGRWRWSAGAEISHSDFRNVFSGTSLTPNLLATGYQLKQITRIDADRLASSREKTRHRWRSIVATWTYLVKSVSHLRKAARLGPPALVPEIRRRRLRIAGAGSRGQDAGHDSIRRTLFPGRSRGHRSPDACAYCDSRWKKGQCAAGKRLFLVQLGVRQERLHLRALRGKSRSVFRYRKGQCRKHHGCRYQLGFSQMALGSRSPSEAKGIWDRCDTRLRKGSSLRK